VDFQSTVDNETGASLLLIHVLSARRLSQCLAGAGALLLDHSGRAEGQRAGAE
jgi:hypothetical protein